MNKAINNRMVNTSAIFIDGTHIKASANKKKFQKEQVAKTLRDEVNAEREKLGKKPIEDDDDDEPPTGTRTVSTKDCPCREKCGANEKGQKVITRHIWQEHLDLVEQLRKTERGKEIYDERKETIERVFADAKEKHAMRHTHHRGLTHSKEAVSPSSCLPAFSGSWQQTKASPSL